MGKQEQKLKEQETRSFCPFQPQFHSLQLERLQQLGLISGLHINPLVPGVGISWTQSTNFSKFFFFFFFKPFLYVFQGSGGACVGEEANLGNELFQANPAARTKEKELKRPLFIVPGGPAGVPVFQPHMTPFCLWVLENKTPTLITLS